MRRPTSSMLLPAANVACFFSGGTHALIMCVKLKLCIIVRPCEFGSINVNTAPVSFAEYKMVHLQMQKNQTFINQINKTILFYCMLLLRVGDNYKVIVQHSWRWKQPLRSRFPSMWSHSPVAAFVATVSRILEDMWPTFYPLTYLPLPPRQPHRYQSFCSACFDHLC